MVDHYDFVHTGIKKYKCDSCDKEYAVRSKLKKHKRNYHSIDNKCQLCDKIFLAEDFKEIHMKQFHEK